jgi:Fic family protein
MADIGQFQPLFPEERVLGTLHELAAQLITACHTLRGQAGQPIVRALRPKLRAMNSYYTNKIEGQHTRPAEIERAIQKHFNADAALARKQRVAVAHIKVEEQLEGKFVRTPPGEVFSPQAVCEIHNLLDSKLPEGDRVTDEGEPIVPGKYRTRDVVAGRHKPPSWTDVDGLLGAWAERYRELAGTEALLIGAACSHHRLAWIHPFMEGNGRAARLHTHLVLHALGLTQGLWSPMRGLARTQEQYFARLSNADLPRRNDLDGRGSLSQEELVAFARYFLDICLDHAFHARKASPCYVERSTEIIAALSPRTTLDGG